MKDHEEQGLSGPWLVPSIFAGCTVILVAVLVTYEPARAWLCPSADTGPTCARSLLSEFQTLITGVAALLAAIITVSTMERTAATARRDQSSLLSLTLRPDYLKIERLIEPQLEQLETCVAYFERFLAALDPYSVGGIGVLRKVERSATNALAIVERACWADAAPLFTGQMTKKLADYRNSLRSLIEEAETVRKKADSRTEWAMSTIRDGNPAITPAASARLVSARTILGFVIRDGFDLMIHMKALEGEYLDGPLRKLHSIKTAIDDQDE